MGACTSAFASCMYACNCCICDCCFQCLMCCKCCCGDNHGPNQFNNEFGLVFYDKLSKGTKLNPVYQYKQEIFEEIASTLNNRKIEAKDEEKMDNDALIIMDVGCGTGNYTQILCDRFLLNDKDILICLDYSEQCLQFVQKRVLEKNKKLQNKNIKFIQTKSNSLCLPSEYDTNSTNLCLMAFVLHHLNKNDKSRDLILKEIYKCLKPNGIFVVMEFGKEFVQSLGHQHGHKHHHKHHHHHGHQLKDDAMQSLKENSDDDQDNDYNADGHDVFTNCDELKQYVESFGFKYDKRIIENKIDIQWIVVFRK